MRRGKESLRGTVLEVLDQDQIDEWNKTIKEHEDQGGDKTRRDEDFVVEIQSHINRKTALAKKMGEKLKK